MISMVPLQCVGAVDGTHVGVKRPSLSTSDFINRKGKYTVNIQAAADYTCCFFAMVKKWLRNVHYARIFSNSKLNTMFREGNV